MILSFHICPITSLGVASVPAFRADATMVIARLMLVAPLIIQNENARPAGPHFTRARASFYPYLDPLFSSLAFVQSRRIRFYDRWTMRACTLPPY